MHSNPLRAVSSRHRLAIALGVALLALLVPAGCRRPQEQGVTVGSDHRISIACIPKATVYSYWQPVHDGVLRAAKELNVRIEWQGPLDDSKVADQIGIFNNLAASGVEGILLSPCDDKALLPHVRNAMKRGVPVSIFDSPLAGKQGRDYVNYIGTNNVEAGKVAARTLIQAISNTKEKMADAASYEGRVIMIRFTEGSANTRQREEGFKDVIAEGVTLRLIEQHFTDGSSAGAQHVAESVLANYVKNNELELDGIFTSNQATTEGTLTALQVLRDKGVHVRTRFVGFDESNQLLQGLKSGSIDALVVQDPEKMGYLGVKMLVDYLEKRPIEPSIDTGVAVMTKADLRTPQ